MHLLTLRPTNFWVLLRAAPVAALVSAMFVLRFANRREPSVVDSWIRTFIESTTPLATWHANLIGSEHQMLGCMYLGIVLAVACL